MEYLNKHSLTSACQLVSLALMFMLLGAQIHAQTKDTSLYHLQEVTILQTKQEFIQPSKKHITLDSLVLARYNTSSVADLLSGQSTVYIKSYGNANIATSSIRGASASHTAVLWNGFNIQNPMLGQADLSLVPAILFDKVSLEYGGGTSMWGSGAIGGSIHLQNNSRFNEGLTTRLSYHVGSFGTQKLGASVLISGQKIVSQTRVYYNTSDNTYTYQDTTDKENPHKKVTHANYTMQGILQELSFQASPFTKVAFRVWYNDAFRNLPSFTALASKQSQADKNLKLSGDWNYTKKHMTSIVRLAYFHDRLDYTDSTIHLFSKTKVQTLIAESDNLYTLGNHRFNVGVNYTSYDTGNTDSTENKNYNSYHQLQKIAVFAAYQVSFWHSKLNYNLSVRKEWTNQTNIPFTGNTGLHYQLARMIALKANANRSFRQPTLNDLYWNPGGNPHLKPEDSYEADGGLELKCHRKNVSVLVEATYFNRHTTNWIIWLPSDYGYFIPKNIAEVYSRGTETKTEVAYRQKNTYLKVILNTSYVLSTNQKLSGENDNSLGRQLTYMPRYSGQASCILGYKTFNLLFSQSYTGYRFTSTDNTSWLNPYYIANLKATYSYHFYNTTLELSGSINNLFNKNYVLMANHPMPLRNVEIGLALTYHKPLKTNKP